MAMDTQFATANLCGLYDAIIYFDETTASRTLAGAGGKREHQPLKTTGVDEVAALAGILRQSLDGGTLLNRSMELGFQIIDDTIGGILVESRVGCSWCSFPAPFILEIYMQ